MPGLHLLDNKDGYETRCFEERLEVNGIEFKNLRVITEIIDHQDLRECWIETKVEGDSEEYPDEKLWKRMRNLYAQSQVPYNSSQTTSGVAFEQHWDMIALLQNYSDYSPCQN